jgi:hypothetical protein
MLCDSALQPVGLYLFVEELSALFRVSRYLPAFLALAGNSFALLEVPESLSSLVALRLVLLLFAQFGH